MGIWLTSGCAADAPIKGASEASAILSATVSTNHR
jgi:hypothetical protein